MFKPKVLLAKIRMGDVEDAEVYGRVAVMSWQDSQQAKDLAKLNIHYNVHTVERIFAVEEHISSSYFVYIWANEYNDEDLFTAKIMGLLGQYKNPPRSYF